MTERVWNQCVDCDSVIGIADEDEGVTAVECDCGRRYTVEKFEGGAALVRIMSDEDRNVLVRDTVLDAITEGSTHGDHHVLVSAVKIAEGVLSCVTIVSPLRSAVELANMHTRAATVLVIMRARGDIDDWSLLIDKG